MDTLEYRKHGKRLVTDRAAWRRPSPACNELDVLFDHYMIVYGDHAAGSSDDCARYSALSAVMLGDNRTEPGDGLCRAGATSIGCYRGDRFVGSLNFCSEADGHPEDTVDSEGFVALWYPLSCFVHILELLRHERRLSLSLIRSALDGSLLRSPIGAVMNLPEPLGREAENPVHGRPLPTSHSTRRRL